MLLILENKRLTSTHEKHQSLSKISLISTYFVKLLITIEPAIIINNINILLKHDLSSFDIILDTTVLVASCNSCAAQTKIKAVTMKLSIGYPGRTVSILLVSLASQMWYWMMKSWNDVKETSYCNSSLIRLDVIW